MAHERFPYEDIGSSLMAAQMRRLIEELSTLIINFETNDPSVTVFDKFYLTTASI
ncbi:hypothetical protein DSUL_60122 [Desulfovibrionales bacterium]